MSSRETTLRAVKALNRPKGYSLLRAFLDEVENGAVARTPAVIALEAAFTEILLHEADPMAALRLKRGRGEKSYPTARQQNLRYGAIWKFIEDKLDEVDPAEHRLVPRGMLAAAKRNAAAKFHKDLSTVERAWKRRAPMYRFIRETIWASAQVKANLTDAEFAQIEDWPLEVPLWIALARKQNQPLGKTFELEVEASVARLTRARRKVAPK